MIILQTAVRRVRTRLERRAGLLAYLVPAMVSAIAVQTWFEPGTAIASGDVSPPVPPEADYASHWSHLTAGAGAPTYDIVSLPYAAWLDAWGWLGADEALGQRLWLTLLFAGSAAAVVFLAFGFTTSSLAAGTAGLLASFNAYRLVLGPDAIPMAAILVAAVLGGLVARAALRSERKASVVGFAVASVGLGYVMSNPPHVALVLLWVAACVVIALVTQPTAAGRTFAFLGKAAPLALLFNAWWIVPAWLTITAPSFGERFAAPGVDEWAWTLERATLANALTLNTTWGWNYPEYFPYADRLGDPPFDVLKVFLPLLAAAGVLLARQGDRRIALGLAMTALAAAWVATGLRAPVAEINRWLYDYVPGYWLFRDPSKLLLLVLLPVALLGGLGVSRLFNVEWRPWLPRVIALGLIAGGLIYVHPLLTGEVIADERPLLPSAHVDLPDAWRQAAATLNTQPDTGKVLILPRSDFYQVPTTWGYYGASFTRWIIRRPVLEAQPGGYFRPARSLSSFEESIESDLLNGHSADVRKKLSALGVRYVLLRRDVDLAFPNRRIARPRVLAQGLTHVPGIRRLRSFGLLEIYRVIGTFGEEVFSATPIFYAGSPDALAPAVSVAETRPAFITERDDQQSMVQGGMRPVRVIRFEDDIVRRVAAKAQGGMLLVRLADPIRLSLGGRKLPSSPSQTVTASLPPDAPVVVTVGSAVFPLRRVRRAWNDLGLVGLLRGQSVSVWRFVGARSFRPASGGPVGDCHAVDNRRAEQVGIRAAVVALAGRPTLRLSARAHSACVTFPLVSGRSPDVYTVRFRYRQLQGSPARACLWQSGLDRCAPVPDLRPGRKWQTFEAAIRPHPRTTSLTLFLYADGRGRAPASVTEYQGIWLERYRRATNVPHAPAQIRVAPESLFPQRTLAVARAQLSRPVDLAKAGPVGDCHRYDERTPAQLGLAAQIMDRSGSPVLRLAARDHSACVAFTITPFKVEARAYRIRFEYRRLSGSSPRACLWQEGPDRCVSISALESDAKWRVLDKTVRLDPNVRALQLFLYADGGGDRLTVTEYRDVHVGQIGSVAILGLPRKEPLPKIVARREAPWKFRVQIRDARAPFLLATSEAYAPGWKARADGREESALRHVQVNGYANGWLVPWPGSYELTLEYGPERYARGARWLSLVALIAVFLWIGARRVRCFARRVDAVRRRRRRAFRAPKIGKHGRARAVQREIGD